MGGVVERGSLEVFAEPVAAAAVFLGAVVVEDAVDVGGDAGDEGGVRGPGDGGDDADNAVGPGAFAGDLTESRNF